MSNRTVSLDLAKIMKENGWDKYCVFYANTLDTQGKVFTGDWLLNLGPKPSPPYMGEIVYLPSSQEILDELPDTVEDKNLIIIYEDGKCVCGYGDDGNNFCISFIHSFASTSLAEALGELRIRCKENRHLSSN